MEEIALAGLRVATGSFFAISGYHKLFNPQRHATLVETLRSNHIPLVQFNQWWVPGVELSAGLGVAFGVLTPIAAAGLLAICLVACLTDGSKRVEAWGPLDEADRMDDWLYLPETLYGLLLALFVIRGSGAYALGPALGAF